MVMTFGFASLLENARKTTIWATLLPSLNNWSYDKYFPRVKSGRNFMDASWANQVNALSSTLV